MFGVFFELCKSIYRYNDEYINSISYQRDSATIVIQILHNINTGIGTTSIVYGSVLQILYDETMGKYEEIVGESIISLRCER